MRVIVPALCCELLCSKFVCFLGYDINSVCHIASLDVGIYADD